MKTYRNHRTIQARASDGSFRRWTGDDVGIGVCPKCSHLTTQPEMPEALKGGHVAPEDFRAWRDARECKSCGWKNTDEQR